MIYQQSIEEWFGVSGVMGKQRTVCETRFAFEVCFEEVCFEVDEQMPGSMCLQEIVC